MRSLRTYRLRSVTAALAIFAVVLHIAFASLHIVAGAARTFAGDDLASGPGFAAVMCLNGGAFDTGLNDGDSDGEKPARVASSCPYCVGAAATAPPLPGRFELVQPFGVVSTASYVPAYRSTLVASPERTSKKSRAPPVFA